MQYLVNALPAFLLACVILAVLPSPAIALLLRHSVRGGRAAGLAVVCRQRNRVVRLDHNPAAPDCRCY
ncbi:hypothetical protein [Mycobacterium lepromatosis]|uniref:hypothetical protein n=1 Tax=Mycobacterium lepromatosis TaxID=480418 RepID=UPI0012E07506|nr:hypothetical protein [Mycobacterium lepromatosis]